MTSIDASQPSDPLEQSELQPGQVLGERYRIEGLLGGGGIGAVYRAAQLPLERPVAVKVLHDDLLEMKEPRQRFEREARVLSALTHPHIVSISDYGIDGDRPYLVMERLEGRTLEDLLRWEKLDPKRALSLARQILEGLAFAHSKGVAHRDLKPANVFLQETARDDREHVKLLDFGLARVVSGKEGGAIDVTLTKRGVVFGTPAYMSPEQAAGMGADVRSDVYSMGILLFEMLTGRRPFIGQTRAELLRGHLADPLPRLASVHPLLRADHELREFLQVATAKEPGDRFVDAGQMLAELDTLPEEAAWLVDDDELSVAETKISMMPPEMPPVAQARGSWAGPVVGVALLAGAALLVGAWVFVEPEPEQRREVAGPIEPAPPPRSWRPEPRDPWEGNLPEPLLPYHAMVEDGHVFRDRREIGPLFSLSRAMPEDPRPLLLMAHLFVARGWYSDAITRYEAAFRLDVSVRGDARMLRSLVQLAANASVGERAADVVERIYGAEALPEVQRAVQAHTGEALSQLRLVRLRERLEADRSPLGP